VLSGKKGKVPLPCLMLSGLLLGNVQIDGELDFVADDASGSCRANAKVKAMDGVVASKANMRFFVHAVNRSRGTRDIQNDRLGDAMQVRLPLTWRPEPPLVTLVLTKVAVAYLATSKKLSLLRWLSRGACRYRRQ
jgi:hypothetical protein